MYLIAHPRRARRGQSSLRPSTRFFSFLVLCLGICGAPFLRGQSTPPAFYPEQRATAWLGVSARIELPVLYSPQNFTATGLPPGLSINSITGVVSGTPTQAGTFNATVSASNSAGTGSGMLIITVRSAPVITSPTTATARVGASLFYTITATENPASFSAENTPPGTNVNFSTGAITGTPSQAGVFTIPLTAINPAGTGRATLTLTVSGTTTTTAPAPVIVRHPEGRAVRLGDSFNLYVSTEYYLGSPFPETYQWFKDGVALPGQTFGSFTGWQAQPEHAGSYTVRVSNANGSVLSNPAIITVAEFPRIVTHPSDQTVILNGTATFTVAISGTGPITYIWTKDGAPVGPNARVDGNRLIISNVRAEDAGFYVVEVRNAVGVSNSHPGRLTLIFPPRITQQPQSRSLPIGDSHTVSLVVEGTPPFTSRWSKDGAPFFTQHGFLQFSPIRAGDAGSYTVTVSNVAGSVTSQPAVIRVGERPRLTTPEQTYRQVRPGASLTLNVGVTSPTPVTYSWFKNNALIPGATTATVTLTNLQLADTGNISVKMENEFGGVWASTRLKVTNNPVNIEFVGVRTKIYDGQPLAVSVTTDPPNLPVQLRYTSGQSTSSNPPVNQGNYTAVAIIQDGTYDAIVSTELKILPKIVPVALVGLHQTYDGTPRIARATAAGGIVFRVNGNGAPVDAGVYPLTFLYENANIAADINYNVMLVVEKAAQAIVLDPLPSSVAVGTTFTLRATATSGMPVTLTLVSGSATLSGNTLTLHGTAPAVVRASQSGNRNYHAATEELTVTAGKQNQTISFPALADRVIDSGPVTLTAQAASGLPVSYAVVGGPATVSGSTLTVAQYEGVVLVRATQAGDTTYNPAPSAVRAFRVRYAPPPTITSHPVSRTVALGSSANFSVGASGSGTLGYHWFKIVPQRAGRMQEQGGFGATSSMTVNNASPFNAGQYAAYVSNGISGIATVPATLTVEIPPFPGAAAPVITGITPEQTVRIGDTVTVNVAVGTDGLGAYYSWRKDGVPLDISNVPYYSIVRFTAEDAGAYSVVVTTPGGTATSGNSVVRLGTGVNPAALPVITSGLSHVVTRIGGSVQLSVTAQGDGLTYQWYRGSGIAIPWANSSTFTVSDPQLADADTYGVWVRDAAGNQSGSSAYVAVLTGNERNPPAGSGSSGGTGTPPPSGVAPSIITQPVGGGYATGASATLSVIVEGTAPFRYEWRREGTPIPGATNATLTFSNLQSSDAGYYSVVVRNDIGETLSNAARIQVASEPPSNLPRPPAITTQPVAQTVAEGNTAIFTINVTGSTPLSYQWRHNRVPLSNGHAATLILYNVTAAQAGDYEVTVVNPYGGVTSATAALTVTSASSTPPPSGTWLEQNIGGAIPAGSAGTSGAVTTVRAGGADIWETSDSFFFRYQALNGDSEIIARVNSLQDTHGWAKAGIMIRESVAAGARNAAVVVSPSFVTRLQHRTTPNAPTTSAPNHWLSGPRWLRLARAGNTFTAYQSVDGVSWTQIGSVQIDMAADVLAGLAVTSHVNGTATAAALESIRLSGTTTAPPPPPPATTLPAPSGLTLTVMSATAITLNWVDNSSNETGFDIQRSADNATFTSIAAVGANVTSFASLGLNASTTYYYRVRTAQGSTLSSFSNVASGTTPSATALPPPSSATWQSVDIGAVAAAGNSSETAGTVTVRGSGADIWDASDEFHFRHILWTGDGEIVARVTGLTDTHGWAKAGLMFRENLTAGSRHVFMCLSAGNGTSFQRRVTTGGTSVSTAGSRSAAPRWLRLVRAGSMFTGYESADGASWTQVGSVAIGMAATIQVGLAVTSHNDGVVCTATFTNVSTPAGDSSAPGSMTITAPTALAGSAMSTSAITLTWSDNSSNEAGFEIQRSLDNVTFTSSATVAVNSTTATITGLNAATLYYFRVRAVAGAVASAFTSTITVSTQTPPPPAGNTGTWESRDIGAVGVPGSTSESAGGVTLAGSGEDIWGTADEFRFRYLSMTGDGEIVARVAALTNTHSWAKAGVMFRESLTAGSRHVFMCISATSGSAFQHRTTTSGTTASTAGRVGSALPRWVRLVRSGNNFTAHESVDGALWNAIETVTMTMPSTLYIGLAVTSHNDAVLCNATFGSVSVTSGSVPPPPPPIISPPPSSTLPAPSNLVAVAISSTEVRLTWTDNSSNEESFYVERSPDNLSYGLIRLLNAGSTTLVDTGRSAGATYYYRVRAVAATAVSPYSNSALVTMPPSDISPTAAWSRTDVGATGVAGSMETSGNTITLRGSGADIWDTVDAFQFLHRIMDGDFVIETQVTSLTNTHAWAKAGVMVRASLAPNARNVFLFLTPSNGIGLQTRLEPTDPRTSFQAGPWGATIPYWIRLVRTGSEIASYVSRDGNNWVLLGRTGFPATAPLYVGFAVTSHDNARLATAVFTDPFIE